MNVNLLIHFSGSWKSKTEGISIVWLWPSYCVIPWQKAKEHTKETVGRGTNLPFYQEPTPRIRGIIHYLITS